MKAKAFNAVGEGFKDSLRLFVAIVVALFEVFSAYNRHSLTLRKRGRGEHASSDSQLRASPHA
jgi:hypothetical protein